MLPPAMSRTSRTRSTTMPVLNLRLFWVISTTMMQVVGDVGGGHTELGPQVDDRDDLTTEVDDPL